MLHGTRLSFTHARTLPSCVLRQDHRSSSGSSPRRPASSGFSAAMTSACTGTLIKARDLVPEPLAERGTRIASASVNTSRTLIRRACENRAPVAARTSTMSPKVSSTVRAAVDTATISAGGQYGSSRATEPDPACGVNAALASVRQAFA